MSTTGNTISRAVREVNREHIGNIPPRVLDDLNVDTGDELAFVDTGYKLVLKHPDRAPNFAPTRKVRKLPGEHAINIPQQIVDAHDVTGDHSVEYTETEQNRTVELEFEYQVGQ